MDRNQFIHACGLLGLGASSLRSLKTLFDAPENSAPVSSCEARQASTMKWIKRFFDIFDQHLDQPARRSILEACGKECYFGSQHGKNQPHLSPADFVGKLNNHLGEEAAVLEGNVIYFRYIKNPSGLRVSDGYCLCPMVETGPEGLSGTYCYCSVGYVREMFRTALGTPVSVELLESLKRGGKQCRFKIALEKES